MKKVDGYTMVKNMAADVEAMMQHKIDAIKVKRHATCCKSHYCFKLFLSHSE